MKKYAYIQYQRIPSETAHPILVTKSAEAVAKKKWDATLVIPLRTQPQGYNPGTIHEYYNLDERLKIKYFWVPELNRLPDILFKLFYRLNYFLPAWFFALHSGWWVARNRMHVIQSCNLEVIIVCRFLPAKFRPKIIYEIHAPNDSWLIPWYQKLAKSVVNLWLLSSEGLLEIPQKFGIDQSKILVLPNGFEPDDYKLKHKKIQHDRYTIGYVGRFETMGIEKGIFDLIKAVALLKDRYELKILIVGGPEKLAKQYRHLSHKLNLTNIVKIKPSVKPNQVGRYITQLDIGTMIYPDVPHFRETMSPMKAIEYMAAAIPVLASDLPACRRILGKYATYVKPRDPENVAAGIEKIIINFPKYQSLADEASGLVQKMSWQNRQKLVLSKLSGSNHETK